ncbi:MAG: RNA polymerase factor sigma-54, partial [Treponema sp.]|nr:RNA polymerase factor sigma-54 [Treponema sp.]
IQSLKLLSMGAEDLREEILAQVEKNPALEILSDNFQNEVKSARFKSVAEGGLHVGSASSLGQEKADAFQEILESRADERKSLFSHLTEQVNMLDLDGARKNLCQKIIGNLDSRGFYILAPSSLLDNKAGQDQKLLEECLGIVQRLDPPGICAENVEKSLLLQAKLKGGASKLALFLLDGHLDFLDPPQGQKVLEKIQGFLAEQKKLSFNKADYSFLAAADIDEIEKALSFIKTLDPFPARNFVQEETHFVYPDIYVENDGDSFKVRMSDKVIPQIRIAPDFGAAKKDSAFAKSAIRQAKTFLESLEYRQNTIAKAAFAIVQSQKEFFKKGPGHLAPLKQKDIAAQIQVHESTVSRMASSKYLQCGWGLFPVKYFFTSAVGDASKESVQRQIREILGQSQKKLSDQKLCDALAQRGIKIARRTVAKYRSQMQMENSYKR